MPPSGQSAKRVKKGSSDGTGLYVWFESTTDDTFVRPGRQKATTIQPLAGAAVPCYDARLHLQEKESRCRVLAEQGADYGLDAERVISTIIGTHALEQQACCTGCQFTDPPTSTNSNISNLYTRLLSSVVIL